MKTWSEKNPQIFCFYLYTEILVIDINFINHLWPFHTRNNMTIFFSVLSHLLINHINMLYRDLQTYLLADKCDWYKVKVLSYKCIYLFPVCFLTWNKLLVINRKNEMPRRTPNKMNHFINVFVTAIESKL